MRAFFSTLFLVAGALLLMGAGLYGLRSGVASHNASQQRYLVSRAALPFPLAALAPKPAAAIFLPELQIKEEPNPSIAWLPLVTKDFVDPDAPPAPEAPPPSPPEPVIRLSIPRLKVERRVMEIGLVHGGAKWDTDALFATRNRPDLVGHLSGSLLPGQGGNIVLAGHNYDLGIYRWQGVFANLTKLNPGDEIVLFTKEGGEHHYVVERVKQVPWSAQNGEELSRHWRFLGPTASEQLTLVTCSGASLGIWNKRVYVVAVPIK